MSKFYIIGTGPGEPDLLTIRAARILSEVDVVFAPNNRGKNMALDSARPHIKDAKIILLDFPMTAMTDELYKKNLEIVRSELTEGKTGCFVTIGDASIYSSILNMISYANEIKAELIFVPGVPAFLYGANRVGQSIVSKGQNFLLCQDIDGDLLDKVDNIAILKTFRDKSGILDLLEEKGFEYTYLSNLSQENEMILRDREDIENEENYLSLILGKKQ